MSVWKDQAEETKKKSANRKIKKNEMPDPLQTLDAPTFTPPKEKEEEPFDFNKTMQDLGYKSMADLQMEQTLRIAIHGMEKSGKTRFAMSAAAFNGLEIKTKKGKIVIPAAHPVVVMDTESGSRQLATQIPEEIRDKVFVKHIYHEDEERMTLDPVAAVREIDKTVSQLTRMGHGTLVIDSIGDWISWLNSVLRLKVLRISPHERVVPSDYFWRNDKMVATIMKMFAIPGVHIIVTGRDTEVYEDARLTPTGRFSAEWYKKVPFWFDIIMTIKKIQTTEAIDRYLSVDGTRFELPPNYPPAVRIDPPTFEQVIKTFLPVLTGELKT